jgi:hypothetical protein
MAPSTTLPSRALTEQTNKIYRVTLSALSLPPGP